MSNVLTGYDMAVAITQNEVNSQFARLATATPAFIDTYLQPNGLSTGWGASYFLSSYLRGHIAPPTVAFTDPQQPDSHDHVLFQFSFLEQSLAPDDLDQMGIDPARLSIPNGATDDGYVLVQEDVPYTDEQGAPQTLSKQNIYYRLRTAKVGAITSYTLVPCVYFESDGAHALVDLSGLQVTFRVNLGQIPTDVPTLQSMADQGIMDPAVLDSITAGKFNQNIFSLQQLFLDFDTVDFTQWQLSAPAGDPDVSVILIEPNQLLRQPLSQLTKENQDFAKDFSSALQYAFGVDGKNPRGHTPYIIGVNASSNDPAQSNPGQPASLVPTYIGYGTSRNPTDATLSTINYQILGGDDSANRIPTNSDGTTAFITAPMVASNDYSGRLMFAQQSFFDPFVLDPIKQAANTGAAWTQDGMTFSSSKKKDHVVDLDESHTTLGTGYQQKVTHDIDYQYQVQVIGDKVLVDSTLYKRQDITITVKTVGIPIPFHWWLKYTVNVHQEITMSIDSNQLVFHVETTQTDDGPHDDHNFGAELMEWMDDVFKTLSAGYFSPLQDNLEKLADASALSVKNVASRLNNGLVSSMSGNFISPTGSIFALKGPRYNDELDLLMDITYRI